MWNLVCALSISPIVYVFLLSGLLVLTENDLCNCNLMIMQLHMCAQIAATALLLRR